jgi:TPR repeat protein
MRLGKALVFTLVAAFASPAGAQTYYFGQNQIADALKLYQKIVDGYKDSPVYAYALYKMAWCYLNPIGTAEPQYTASLNKFVETVKATLEGRAGNEANAKQLRRDARRDMVKTLEALDLPVSPAGPTSS